MPADEVRHENSAAEFRERTGPRHAAPRKPMFTRLHIPAGKAIAIAAMPTAVLMGMGLTPTLAQAKDNPTKFSADDYKACADAIKASEDGKDATDGKGDESASPTPTPSPSASAGKDTSDDKADSGDKAEPTPSPSASKPSDTSGGSSDGSTAGTKTATPTPAPSETKNPLDPLGVGDALKDLLTPKEKESATPTPSPSASASKSTDVGGTVKDTVGKVTKPVTDTADKAGDAVKDTVDKAGKAVDDAADKATKVVPTPSPSETGVPDNCPVATDAEGDNEQTPAQVPNDSWHLEASSLTLKGADYQGVVNVRTPNGTIKKVLKYVISNGTDIGDLHQTVDGPDGKTYHVQAGKGTTSTIRGGTTTMYTESISGNLLGLIPITFDAEHPPPLNIPLIYFTNVKVKQAGQFGGDLHVPGLHQYLTG
ncbi:hypothetical protein ACFWVU_06600 [Streptomyces sp. NPDC058686]|uniref:hypothetical protein n=1 Tax=Streptomyces sp. NPDC058686 TaxID=3346599 RepID=UPI00364864D1